MARFNRADDPIDPHTYETVSFKVNREGETANPDEDGTWTTVVDRYFLGTLDDRRVIKEGMTTDEMHEVHELTDLDPELGFRYGRAVGSTGHPPSGGSATDDPGEADPGD